MLFFTKRMKIDESELIFYVCFRQCKKSVSCVVQKIKHKYDSEKCYFFNGKDDDKKAGATGEREKIRARAVLAQLPGITLSKKYGLKFQS